MGLLQACGGGSSYVGLPAEFTPSIESWLLARVTPDNEVSVTAADRSAPSTVFPPEDGVVRLEVRGFEASLANLGLDRGPLKRVEPGHGGMALPAGTLRFAAELTGTTLSDWVPKLATRDPAEIVDGLSFELRSPCSTLVGTSADLPTRSAITWAVSMDSSSVLLGSYQDAYAVSARVGAEPTVVPWILGSLPMPRPRCAFRDARGRLWLGDEDGSLWLGTPESAGIALSRVVQPRPEIDVRQLDGDPSDPEHQLYALAQGGTIHHLEGDRWVLVDDLALTNAPEALALAWLGPGELLAGASSRPKLRHIVAGQARDLGDFGVGVVSMGHLGPRLIGIGAVGGTIARFQDQNLEPPARSSIALDVKAFAPMKAGAFLYAGASGYVGEWNPAVGYCPVQTTPLAPRTVSFALPLGDEVLLLGDSPGGGAKTRLTRISFLAR